MDNSNDLQLKINGMIEERKKVEIAFRKVIKKLRAENERLKTINRKAFEVMERICELTDNERIIALTDKPWLKEL